MFIQLKAHKAHVYSQIEIDPSKKNIVLIPGAGMDHRTLSMFKLDSIKETHNVIAFDLPGHGYTTGPLFTDVESHTDFCIDLLNELNLKDLTLAGHSWGALIALDLSTKYSNEMTVCMNVAYPFTVGDILLDHAKGNLDQAVEFLTKYGVYKIPSKEKSKKSFGVMGSSFYKKTNGKVISPYGSKNIDDPEREVALYDLKKLFNQISKDILAVDMNACMKFRMNDQDLKKLQDINVIIGEMDKLVSMKKIEELIAMLGSAKVIKMEGVAHFPFFEDPKVLNQTLEEVFSTYI